MQIQLNWDGDYKTGKYTLSSGLKYFPSAMVYKDEEQEKPWQAGTIIGDNKVDFYHQDEFETLDEAKRFCEDMLLTKEECKDEDQSSSA